VAYRLNSAAKAYAGVKGSRCLLIGCRRLHGNRERCVRRKNPELMNRSSKGKE
jgi:hypothetical protein